MSRMSDKERVEAARKKLEAAVDAYFEESGWNDAGVLTSWMFIGHQLSYDDSGGMEDTYAMMYKGGQASEHVALGLLGSAKRKIDSTPWVRREGDED